MTIYARVKPGPVFDCLMNLTPEQYAALQANGKAAYLRLWSVDAYPAPSPTQLIIPGPIVIDATTARQTWALRGKTPRELGEDANAAELSTLLSYIEQWTTDIQAYTPNIDTTGTQAVQAQNMWNHIKDIQRQVMRNNRALRFLARERIQ